MKKGVKTFLGIGIFLFLGAFLMLHFVMPKLLINTRIGAAELSLPADAIPYQQFTSTSFDGLKLEGLYFKPEIDSLHKTVIMLHGLRSSKEYYYSIAKGFVEQGISVLLIDHRAHGKSEGEYCTFGVKEKLDVKAWVDQLKEKYPENQVGIFGQALGGAIGLQAMGIDDRIEFAVIESTFSHLKTVGPDYISRMFGVNWSWLNKYIDWRAGTIGDFDTGKASPYEACKKITQPVLLAHGDNDQNINVKYGNENFSVLKSEEKYFVSVPDAGHNTVWFIGGEDYKNTVFSFILEH